MPNFTARNRSDELLIRRSSVSTLFFVRLLPEPRVCPTKPPRGGCVFSEDHSMGSHWVLMELLPGERRRDRPATFRGGGGFAPSSFAGRDRSNRGKNPR